MAMRFWSFVLSCARAGDDVVVVLSTTEFEAHLEANVHSLVEFYAPWCGHCKKLAPEFSKAAGELKSYNVSFGNVDATKAVDLSSKYNIRGYPTLVWFDHGKEYEYDGGRTSESIVEWVLSMIGDPVQITTQPEPPAVDKPRVVLYSESLLPGFEAAAKAYRRKATWYFVQTSGMPKVVLTHKGEDPVVMSDGSLEEEHITSWFQENALPLVGLLDADSFHKYVDAQKGLIWGLFPMEGETAQQAVAPHRPMLMEIARAVRGKYFVVHTDVEAFGDAIQSMLGVEIFPAIVVQRKAGDKIRWIFNGTLAADEVKAFLNGIESDSIAPILKSESPPDVNDDVVFRVVGNTLQKDVFTQDLDVFLQVYAPWCGHCKKMDVEFRTVAKKVKKEQMDDILRIATMDGTANDSPVESITWDGFPTLWFVKAGSDDPLKYDGERNAKAMWKFIKKASSKSKTIKERLEIRRGSKSKACVQHGGSI